MRSFCPEDFSIFSSRAFLMNILNNWVKRLQNKEIGLRIRSEHCRDSSMRFLHWKCFRPAKKVLFEQERWVSSGFFCDCAFACITPNVSFSLLFGTPPEIIVAWTSKWYQINPNVKSRSGYLTIDFYSALNTSSKWDFKIYLWLF